MPRLPKPGSDDGTWGAVLNEFLSVAHATDGSLLPGSVGPNQLADKSITAPNFLTTADPAANQLLAYDGSSLTWVSRTAAGDPTLGGDLTGTASNAQLSDSVVDTNQLVDGSVTDDKVSVSAAIAQSKVANLVNDLAGKANVSALNAKVDSSRQVNTAGSLTGGGTLTGDITLGLVNDQSNPGVSKYYGTNSGGTKGYYDLPSGGGAVNITDLSDVSITALQQGQVLKYDGINWVNDTDATGGGGANTFDKFTDGTNVASADSSTDTFKFRSSDNSISTVVTNDDLTHGDNVNLTIATNGVSNAQLAKAAGATLKGNAGASLGNVSDISITTVAGMLPAFTTSSKGAVPVSPGGTTSYLRADGTWSVPSGTVTTGANAGATGVSVFKTNSGSTIQLKSISAGSSAVSITDDTANSAVKVDVTPANFSANSVPQAAVNGLSATLSNKQALNADLTAIAALTPANDDLIQRKAGAWVNRTPAQLKTDLALSKADIGLANVDNTSDANKPVSNAVQNALDGKVDKTSIGAANGVASLDASGKVPAGQLPSYVDQVQEFASVGAFPATGTASVIYVDTSTSKTYRWSGSQYVQINSSPGTTDEISEGATNKYFTDVRAKDAVGAGIGSTNTVNLAYNPTTKTLSANAKTQFSITSDTNGLKLLNETATPGASKYYGTDASGTRGFFTLATSSGETNTASNLGAGIGLYKTKNIADLQFKSLNAGTATNGITSIQLTDNTAANTVDLEVKPNTTKQKIEIASNGTVVGTRKQINFKNGTNTTVTVQDNGTLDGVDVTIAGAPNADATNAGVIKLAGDLTGSSSYATPTLGANVVGNTKLAQMPATTIKGNSTGATANATDLTPATVTTMLPQFGASGASHAKGLVPDPGATAGTTKYLREDGSWAAPVQGTISWGTSVPTGGSDGDLYFQLA